MILLLPLQQPTLQHFLMLAEGQGRQHSPMAAQMTLTVTRMRMAQTAEGICIFSW